MLITVSVYFGFFIICTIIIAFIGDAFFRSPGWKGPVSDHFDGKKFFNRKDPDNPKSEMSGLGVLKWLVSRDKNVWKKRSVITTKPASRVLGPEIVVTFINHATVLIQTDGINIITDPVYSKRASPVSFAGPGRYTDPGVIWSDMPPIDVVLLSHNHYDHMDITTLKKLRDTYNPDFFAPLGNKSFLRKKGIESYEMDWWDTHTLKGGVVTCVPAQHFSARALSDRNKSLWGGYVIQTKKGNVYFAGDTGYGPHVKEIAKRFPSGFRLGLLPIGAFKPEWFMREVHVSPTDSVRIAQELSIKKSMAIHFGTFKLADDTQDEPVTHLNSVVKKYGVDFESFPNGGRVTII